MTLDWSREKTLTSVVEPVIFEIPRSSKLLGDGPSKCLENLPLIMGDTSELLPKLIVLYVSLAVEYLVQ